MLSQPHYPLTWYSPQSPKSWVRVYSLTPSHFEPTLTRPSFTSGYKCRQNRIPYWICYCIRLRCHNSMGKMHVRHTDSVCRSMLLSESNPPHTISAHLRETPPISYSVLCTHGSVSQPRPGRDPCCYIHMSPCWLILANHNRKPT